MASTIAHTHLTAHTFHMDIKSSNILLDSRKYLVMINWEQRALPLCALAPEVDGSEDVKEVRMDFRGGAAVAKSKLVYEMYCGPDRENVAALLRSRMFFSLWRDSYSHA